MAAQRRFLSAAWYSLSLLRESPKAEGVQCICVASAARFSLAPFLTHRHEGYICSVFNLHPVIGKGRQPLRAIVVQWQAFVFQDHSG